MEGLQLFLEYEKMLIQNARMYSFQQNTECELDISQLDFHFKFL
jgi:hypothetical protein